MIEIRYRKWDGADHGRLVVRPLGRDAFGWWLSGRSGAVLERHGRPSRVLRHDFVVLVPDHGDWTARWSAPGGVDVYVDVCTLPQVDDRGVTAVDMDLDVVRSRDGRVEVQDEDEFEQNRVALGYPDCLVDSARATSSWVSNALVDRREPFAQVGAAWLTSTRVGVRGRATGSG